jgi:hypothetical protein
MPAKIMKSNTEATDRVMLAVHMAATLSAKTNGILP